MLFQYSYFLDRCLELQNVLCGTFVYFQEPCLRIAVRCHVGLLKCWVTEEIGQASSTRTGGTRDVLQPGSCERAMYTPFFFMSQIMTQQHCLPASRLIPFALLSLLQRTHK